MEVELTRKNRVCDEHKIIRAILEVLPTWNLYDTTEDGQGGGYSLDLYFHKQKDADNYFDVSFFWPDDGTELMVFIDDKECVGYTEDVKKVIEVLESFGFIKTWCD